MPITDIEYYALEDIVGADYISRDPAVIECYCQCWGHVGPWGGKYSPRPAAVILPGTTDEIEAIVKICNKLDMRFKPLSSGFESVTFAQCDDRGLLLDMKRMNRIVEIDAKNQRAVVESYVNGWNLEHEVAKYGMMAAPIGVGPSGGVIAGACCHFGAGNLNCSMGGLGRNVLGVEWVLPDGTVYTMGSGEGGTDWFSADGPGPSMRGVLRGRAGANGGHGVITRASVKIYPWYGDSEITFAGPEDQSAIHKGISSVPERYKIFMVDFHSREKQFEALRKIGMTEACQMLAGALAFPLTEGNDERYAATVALQEAGVDFNRVADEGVVGVIAAETERGMAYREAIVNSIVEEIGGDYMPLGEEQQAQMFPALMWNFGYVIDAFRNTGDFLISPTSEGSPEKLLNMRKAADAIITPEMRKGRLLDCDVSQVFLIVNEQGAGGFHMENVCFWDPYNEDSVKAYLGVAMEAQNPDAEKSPFPHLGLPHLGAGLQIEWTHHVHEDLGPVYNNYDYWLRQVKHAIDPNNAAEWSAYIPEKYDPRFRDRVFWNGEWLSQDKER